MKIYDKEIYNKQKSLNTVVIIVVAFIIGFVVGYFGNAAVKNTNTVHHHNNTVNNKVTQNTEIKRDTI